MSVFEPYPIALRVEIMDPEANFGQYLKRRLKQNENAICLLYID